MWTQDCTNSRHLLVPNICYSCICSRDICQYIVVKFSINRKKTFDIIHCSLLYIVSSSSVIVQPYTIVRLPSESFITICRKMSHWSLSCAMWVQSAPSHSVSSWPVLISIDIYVYTSYSSQPASYLVGTGGSPCYKGSLLFWFWSQLSYASLIPALLKHAHPIPSFLIWTFVS